ncbi:MAG: AAA family ATPase [Anaerolineae bacterium]|jgi:LuxR family maltose regulon positive regulatory protein
MTEETGVPFLSTKLHIPPRRPGLVSRPRLVARLDQALSSQHRLTLVSAKAGMGKTTLVSDWLHRQERPAQWLSLDESDSDPRRFVSYLLAALGQAGLQSKMNHLEAPQLPPMEALVTELINEVASIGKPFLLVLDDYHLIQNEWIHQAVGYLATLSRPGGKRRIEGTLAPLQEHRE